MLTKFQVEHCSDVKVFRAQNHRSGHAQAFPPGNRNLKEVSHPLQGSRAQKEQLTQKSTYAWIRSLRMILSKVRSSKRKHGPAAQKSKGDRTDN